MEETLGSCYGPWHTRHEGNKESTKSDSLPRHHNKEMSSL